MSDFKQEDMDRVQKWLKDTGLTRRDANYGIKRLLDQFRESQEKARKSLEDENDKAYFLDTNHIDFTEPEKDEPKNTWWDTKRPRSDESTLSNFWGLNSNRPMLDWNYGNDLFKTEKQKRNEAFEKWLNALP